MYLHVLLQLLGYVEPYSVADALSKNCSAFNWAFVEGRCAVLTAVSAQFKVGGGPGPRVWGLGFRVGD